MVSETELMPLSVGETGSVIKESLEKVAQAIEMESQRLREQAKQESNQIIAMAREEAEEIISQARQEAKVESDKLIAQTQRVGEKIIKESREKACTEARQESERIIGEAREKLVRIITEVSEKILPTTKDELARRASETRNKLETKKSELINFTKSVEQILDENEANIQTGSECLYAVIDEIKNKLQMIIETTEKELVDSEKFSDEVIEVRSIKQPEKPENDPAPVEGSQKNTEKPPKVKGSDDARLDARIQMQEGLALLKSGKNEEALEAFIKVIEHTVFPHLHKWTLSPVENP